MEFDKETHSEHISTHFDAELEQIKSNLMAMGGLVEQQLADALAALASRDALLAERAQKSDKKINQMEMTIDEECIRIIARRQPAASDLRLVVAISKANRDLERVGDETCRIARYATKMLREDVPSNTEVRHIGRHVSEMVRNSLTAFARYDTELAYQVAREDFKVDEEYKFAMRALVTDMMEEPRHVARNMNIIWILRSLERIGDHACNISDHLIYLVKGINVSHSSLEQIKETVRE
jgi:phosphate transport system protein